ncbi:MAG: hypothetical protein DDG60_13550 [Anaerolineae bacterium]|nr:MAG: hypothetical protein DDG60_13550 [Anaerolineae bacterium]
MKTVIRYTAFLMLAVLLVLPMQRAYAKEENDGPFFGESVTLTQGQTFDGDLVVFGGSVNIEQEAIVNGSVIVIGGSLFTDGEVRGDVVVIGGAVSLAENAHITGNLSTIGAPVNRAIGAQIDGSILNNPQKPIRPRSETLSPSVAFPSALFQGTLNFFGNVLNLFMESVGLGLLAALLVLFLPQQTRRVGEIIPTNPAWAGVIGLGSILLLITLLVALGLFSVLIVTLVLTIPLIFGIAIIFVAAVLFGWISLGTEIGLRLATAFKTDLPLPLSAGIGTFLLSFTTNGLGMLPLLGWLFPAAVGLIALGAVLLTRFGTYSIPRAIQDTPPISPAE